MKRHLKAYSFSSFVEEQLGNEAVEPVCIYDTLHAIGMITNDAQKGHQEDAEEFLSSVLNGLNEELIRLSAHLQRVESGESEESVKKDEPVEEEEEDGDNMWREVGTSKHKALPTRSVSLCLVSKRAFLTITFPFTRPKLPHP